MSDISLLKPLGYQRKNECGYCKDATGSSSYYLSSSNLRLDHYQELMDRGWRRSGTLYYKPDLSRMCCPHYTIRLKAAEFQAKRDQRQAVHRLNNHILGAEYKRKVAMLCPQSRQEKKAKKHKFELLDAVHLAEYSNVKRPIGRKSKQPIEPAHKLVVNLEADSSTKEKYAVFLKYQVRIHKDPISRWKDPAFKRFLCSGLSRKNIKTDVKTQKLGSYHQTYRLDGKLVAVGVLDLLPHAVSSVYLFYDPDYAHWDWGKISALQEIALTIEGGYEYYYMGFYIHSCVKMRYKGTFSPSYLLDPESLQWDFLDDEFRDKLDRRRYVSLSGDRMRPPATVDPDKSTKATETPEINEKPTEVTNSSSEKVDDDKDLEFDEEESEDEDAEMPEGSLFDYKVPGVLTKGEVAKLDLGHWKLVVRQSLIDLEDLRSWEQWSLDDPGSIKGIAAELIATTGPKLLQHSAISLF